MRHVTRTASLLALFLVTGCASPPKMAAHPVETADKPSPPLQPARQEWFDVTPPPPSQFPCPTVVVKFEPGSETISKRYAAVVTDALPIQIQCFEMVVQGIAGPSDQVADLAGLARHRARVVADFLIKSGLDPHKIRRESHVDATAPLNSQSSFPASESREARIN